jgi:hypothetical protein
MTMITIRTKYLPYILFLLILLPLAGRAQVKIHNLGLFPKTGPDRFNRYLPRSLYLEPGGGVGIWQQSDQVNMQPRDFPVMGFVEVSKDLSPLSYGVSYNTLSSYQQEQFFLQPEYGSLYAKFSPGKLFFFFPPALDVFAMAGVTAWRAELTDERNPSDRLETPVQSDNGMGLMAGAGARLYIRNFGIGAQWNYFFAQGNYLIDPEEAPVAVETGSAQVQITLSYRFQLGELIRCPKL